MRRFARLALLALGALLALAIVALVVLLAWSASRAPTEVRLALTGAGEYELDWATHEPLAPIFGANDAATLDNATARGAGSTVFLRGDSWPWLTALTTHRAPLGRLAPGSAHAYAAPGGPTVAFRAAPAANLTIVVLGDTGLNEHDAAFAQRAAALKPDLVLHVGDLAYAFNDEWKWEAWMAALQPASEAAPFEPVPGNHEKEYGESYRNYDARFAPDDVHHASFELGPCHFVRLDSEDMDAAQDAWLARDLAGVDRARTPCIVAMLHRPMYSSGVLHTSDKPARDHFEKLFDDARVTLVLAGHEHNYERTCPVKDGACAAGAPVYVVTGGGGATLYPDFIASPPWSQKRAAEHEMLVLHVSRAGIEEEALREDGSVLDETRIAL